MHHNFYFLRQIVPCLHNMLAGTPLIESFTQDKNELVLGFGIPKQDFWIRASFKSNFSCLYFPRSFSRAKKNSADLFPEVINSMVERVTLFEFERSFLVEFSNRYSMLFKLHGNRSNILLLENSSVVKLFNNRLLQDWNIQLSELNKHVDLSEEAFFKNHGDIKKLNPTYGKIPQMWLEEKGYTHADMSTKWKLFQDLNHKLSLGQFYLVQTPEMAFSLLPVGKHPVELSSNPLEAINEFFITASKHFNYQSKKKNAIKLIEQRLKKLESYQKQAQLNLDRLHCETPLNQVADVIMANMHQLQPGKESVKLENFYTGKEIEIKLKKDLSPQKNAERYYQKSKNREKELKILTKNIEERKHEIKLLSKQLEAIAAAGSEDEIKEIHKEPGVDKIKKRTKEESLPYKEYEYKDFKIWVGRNAKANDKLTLKYSHKNDLWLHSKDVAGSHVIIKQNPGKSFPVAVKERAAQIAAWYSKRKTETVVPVICTPKKYIRKPKGLPAGAVIVDREEEVLLVSPKDIN